MPIPVSCIFRMSFSQVIVTPPARVYFTALDSTCPITNSSHFSSVSTMRVEPAHLESQLLANELPGKPPHRGFYDVLQAAFLYNVVGVAALKPDVAQHHLNVLLYPRQLLGEGAALRGVLLRQREPHRRDGSFYLVRPHRVVVRHVGNALLVRAPEAPRGFGTAP